MQEVRAPSELMNLKQDIFQLVVKQLEKDFAMSGVIIDFSIDVVPDKMWEIVLSTLDDLLKNEPESLRNLIYIVDLNESAVNAMVLEKKVSDFLIELAQQLIAREIQKVLNRLNYRLD